MGELGKYKPGPWSDGLTEIMRAIGNDERVAAKFGLGDWDIKSILLDAADEIDRRRDVVLVSELRALVARMLKDYENSTPFYSQKVHANTLERIIREHLSHDD